MNSKVKPNQPLVTHIYTADPSAHVFDGKIYIYPSHDLDEVCDSNDNGDQYNMTDYHILSIDNFDSPCVDNGEALHLKDIPWATAQLWAPDAAYKNGTYYLYFPARDKDNIFRIGVATSKNPVGPFKAQDNYITGSYSVDPAVFMDDDKKVYFYFGGLWGGQLEKWQTGVFLPDAEGPDVQKPALGPRVAELNEDMLSFKETPQEISIVDENGNAILAGDQDRRYFEGPWMHKYNGNYYLSYSTGTTHYIVYAMSKNPKGPFVYKGKILNPVLGWTTHHSIVKVGDKWYLFYHDSTLSKGADNRRCVKYTEISYNSDGTIQTFEPD
jgi:Glycosyl hydrolases family 43